MYTDRYWHEREFDTVHQYQNIAKEADYDPVTLAVAWVLANPAITAPIIGASQPSQLKASLAAAELKLDRGLKEKLNALTNPFRFGDATR